MSAINDINKALTIQYDASVAASFVQYLTDEGFDEDTLRDDIDDVEDDLDNCSVIEHLAKTFPKQFPDEVKQKELLILLKNALKGELPEVATARIVDPNSVKWKVSRAEAKYATEFITKHCPRLLESREKTDKALMDVLAIGIKNDFPLLNWLTDTYSRYRINNHYQNRTDITTTDWRKKYKFFSKLRDSNNTKTAEKMESAIKSFFKRMFNQITLTPSVSVIDDNINEYIPYFIAMNEAIESLTDKNIVPFQIDMWIIPKNVECCIAEFKDEAMDDIDSGGDSGGDSDKKDDLESEFEEIGVDKIGNLDYRLKKNNFKYEMFEIGIKQKEKIRRNFVQKLESFISGERNQRIIIYIDRRNPHCIVAENKCAQYVANNYGQNVADDFDTSQTLAQKMRIQRRKFAAGKKTWDDRIYFVQSNKKEFQKLPSLHTPETLFWASTQCMLPHLDGEKISVEVGYGCRNDFNGYQFMLSWHVESQDLIKSYWFTSCWGARLFPFDCFMLWPRYFKQHKQHKKAQAVQQDFIKKLKSMPQCHDAGFLNWFETTTQSKLLLFS